MEVRTQTTEHADYEKEAAQFLARCEKRAKGSGGAGCLLSIGAAVLLGAMGALESFGGWVLLVVGVFVTFGLLAKRTVRQSAEDFQHTFRAAGGAARREQALCYLWDRAQGASANTPAGKAAKDLLAHLGVRTRPRRTPEVQFGAADATVVVETAPRVPPPVVLASTPARPSPATPTPPATSAPASASTSAPHPARTGERPKPTVPARHSPSAPTSHAPASTQRSAATPSSTPTPHSPSAAPSAPARHVPPVPPAAPAAGMPGRATPPPPVEHAAPVGPAASFPAAERALRCEYCGTVRTARPGAEPGLCPTCYPQIRLDG